MTYYDIYLSALAFIGESEDLDGAADYKKRAVLLLPHIAASLSYANRLLGNDTLDIHGGADTTLDSDFPLDFRLSSAASAQLASLLVIDELPELSQTLAKHATDKIAHVLAEATDISSTKEVY